MASRLWHVAGPLVVATFALGVVTTPSTRAADVGYVEAFALAKDRTASLKQLIPGTEDFYYYHGLHALNTEQYEKFVEQTRPWLERFGQTPRLTELQTRHLLLTFDKDPKKTLETIRAKLGLNFYHRANSSACRPICRPSWTPRRSAVTRFARTRSPIGKTWKTLKNLRWIGSLAPS